MEGLENKLSGVNIGDIIILEGAGLEISGYIIKLDPKKITLSHENPFSECPHQVDSMYRDSFSIFDIPGNRTYFLGFFDSYEVLRTHKQEEAPK